LSAESQCSKILEIEVHWPKGVDSPIKTREVFVKGPVLLVIQATIDPYIKNVGWPYCWNNSSNTIPPFSYGPGISDGRVWENGVQIEWLKAKQGSRVFCEGRHKIRGTDTQGGKLFIVPPQVRNLAGAFVNQYAQYFKITIVTYPLESNPEWGLGEIIHKPNNDIVNGTRWSVNGHPVHWVFSADGTVSARGLWNGTWIKTESGYRISITHKGATDSFIVKFSSDGKSFTAYKNGKVYRRGVFVKQD